MNYKIWKASVTEYRVQNVHTSEVQVLENFTAEGCQFKVNLNLYDTAKQNNFANSGDDFDYFAWIEAEIVGGAEIDLDKKVFYNPFKHTQFRDRETLENKHFTNKLVINGNTLSYE